MPVCRDLSGTSLIGDLLKPTGKLAGGVWERFASMIREKHLRRTPSFLDAVMLGCDAWSRGSRFEVTKPQTREDKAKGRAE